DVLPNHRVLAWEPGSIRLTLENGATKTLEAKRPKSIALENKWSLSFPPGWGVPASVQLDRLTSWTNLDLPVEARAFSGTATYNTEFTTEVLPASARAELDLGRVEVIARVWVNGDPAGVLWTPPYRLDITHLVKPGANRLTVEVISTWFNRLVYDAGLEGKARKTWTISGPAKDRTLVPSGLLGPVTLRIGEML
ncbi:MAG TPA: DNA-binding protein, partial [Clostridia bacterium]|nr:DNA-binding protein [Clostridia bacterium]